MTTKGIYNTLVTQLDKLARHNRQGSFRTKYRYYEAVKRFCAYLAAHYHLQKLENISGKHLVSYVLYLQEQGKSASTIKTDLSAIRFFHDKMSHPRYALPSNEELGVALERRRFGQQDRTWTNQEFGKLIGRAMAEEREDYILALYLARYAGLRIHECFRMDTAAAERALRENALTVKGKGGKIRIVPIEDDRITMMLQRLLEKTERGHKLLVQDGVPTDRARVTTPVCQAHDKKYILQKQKSQTTNFDLIVWGFCFCVALVPLFLLKMPVTVWHFHITNSHQGFLIITDSVY